jgi:alanine dehydrogenase
MTLLLTRRDVAALLTLDECIAAVEKAFRLRGEGSLQPAGMLGVKAPGGGFHIKAALMGLRFAAKVNGNFSGNPQQFGLPAIQGLIVLGDAENGRPLAVLDSIEITLQRTAAATAVAARHLARRGARTVTICGCGNQGFVQLRALARVLPLARAYAYDIDGERSRALAVALSSELGFEVSSTADLPAALAQSDVCVTCTPARKPFVRREWIRPGTFIAAVGADSPDKQELEPSLLAASKIVVDAIDQCAEIGELHHALAAGLVERSAVHAELGAIVAGRAPGRASEEEVIVFDSTGTALQDVAAAAVVYEKAIGEGRGAGIDFAA